MFTYNKVQKNGFAVPVRICKAIFWKHLIIYYLPTSWMAFIPPSITLGFNPFDSRKDAADNADIKKWIPVSWIIHTFSTNGN